MSNVEEKGAWASMSSMMMQTQTVMLMTLFTTLFSGIITSLINLLTEKVKNYYNNWSIKPQQKFNSITIQRNKYMDLKHGHNSDPDYRSQGYLQAFLSLITEQKQYSSINTTQVVDTRDNDHATTRKQYLGYELRIIPKDPVVINGFTITYTTSNSNKDKEGNQKEFVTDESSVTITSTKSAKEIEEFIDKVYKEWIDKNYPPIQETEEQLLSFEQIPSDGQTSIFMPYNIPRNINTFDELFFDQKEELDRVLDLFKNKKIHRLGIMMSGEPGGGKTSLARAIAVKFNLHIIVINLNMIKNDAQLKEIVQGSQICYRQNGGNYYIKIPAQKRLYLLDDADCSSDLLMDRELKSKSKEIRAAVTNAMYGIPNKPSKKNEDGSKVILDDDDDTPKFYRPDKLTLKGILDVMDGITPMGGILILNTNRPNDIDSAVKRPGRIDIQLSLSRMSTKHVNDLIKYYGYDINIDIPDRLLMGCIVKNLCTFSKDNDDLIKKLQTEIINQQQLLEKKKLEAIETDKLIENVERKSHEMSYAFKYNQPNVSSSA
ncbi:putative AAA+ family ATPase [Fadolivirus algeromassiliense]|jgi:hypothetical protein|uniref:AAA+ family ATPase n=1 Tax=Fadolivirus FV1/VV64 TaxID=3070911 RepID=A0A7D3V8I6_9VIRU|nr:putative AAA+ family ATPase [Fadolivirus algeromassiliense]QKF93557.1 putative AAA+ family ATPase [Fadolivirus FV1/VV64]